MPKIDEVPVPMLLFYMGRPVEELSREELIECVKALFQEQQHYMKLAGEYLDHLDIASYLRSKK